MKLSVLLVFGLLTTALFAGCTQPGATGDTAAIETSHGCILIEFFEEEAPQTVENFVQYANDGFYEGTIFHRIIQGFMIQGGGFTEDGQQKQPRDPVPLEYEVPNERGNVAMARTGDPDSATSQFFINTVDNSQNLGPGGADQFGYTVFAHVVEGMDVVDEIAAESTGLGPQRMQNWPNDPPVIDAVEVGGSCEGGEPSDPEFGVEAGLITDTMREDGVWETLVSASVDYIPLWVMNTGDQADTFDLSVEAPADWEVTLDEGSMERSRGGRAGDAGAAFLTIEVDEGDPREGNITVFVVSQGDREASAEIVIEPIFAEPFVDRVSAPGDQIDLSYTGSFDDGEVFDSGSFSMEVGGGRTVPGFDTGLMGIAANETTTIRFPPELGYGYNPGQGREQFAGEWLNFEVTVESIG